MESKIAAEKLSYRLLKSKNGSIWASLCISTLVIFIGFFLMNMRQSVWNYDSTSAQLVENSLDMAFNQGKGTYHSGGFMTFNGEHTYFSQFGLQYRLLAEIPWLGKNLRLARWTFGFLTSIVLSFFCAAVRRELGNVTWFITMICIAVSEPIALLAMHLYWSIFCCSLLLPCLVCSTLT